jgi:hypothetical protein
MSTENQNIPEEIDLGILLKKINGFFGTIAFSIFKGILFLKKNILILIALIFLGGAFGYYLDSENTSYDTNIIVTPNLGGTDYLYSKIDLLSSKLKENDKVFFKSIGITSNKIVLIEIDPVIDIYSFVNSGTTSINNTQNNPNFDLIKLLSESSDINKVIKDNITSKNYLHHTIHIVTNSKITENEVVKPILKFLNTDAYFGKLLDVSRDNINNKIIKSEELISQTDSLINTLTRNISNNNKSSNLVYNNEDNQFNQLFEFKNNLINEIALKKIEIIKAYRQELRDIINTVNSSNILNGIPREIPKPPF